MGFGAFTPHSRAGLLSRTEKTHILQIGNGAPRDVMRITAGYSAYAQAISGFIVLAVL
jgi:hypothetical protein